MEKENKETQNLRLFGEVGVKLSKLYGLPEKLSNKGNYCIMVGYPDDHPSDTYRVLDLKTLGIMLTRNVRQLDQDEIIEILDKAKAPT
jgi:hypothetical protein